MKKILPRGKNKLEEDEEEEEEENLFSSHQRPQIYAEFLIKGKKKNNSRIET